MAAPGTPLNELFAKHKADIGQVLINVNDFLSNNKHYTVVFTEEFPLDELCVVKYLLSSPKKIKCAKTDTPASLATAALIETIKFRYDRHDQLAIIAKMDIHQAMRNNYVRMDLGGILGSEVVVITQIGITDLREVAKLYETAEDFANAGLAVSELGRIYLDERSRATGKLCKMISIHDLRGAAMMNFSSNKVLKGIGMVSSWNDDHSPQFSSRVCLINTPMIFSLLLKLARPFMSKSTLEKMIHCGKKRGQSDISLCPFLAKYGRQAKAQIPESFGGEFKLL